MSERLHEAIRVADGFALGSRVRTVEPFGNGLINDTFLVTTNKDSWVLQRINSAVFSHPERIMRNLALLSAHLAKGPQVGLRVPALIPAADGNSFLRGADGDLWRLMELIENARALDRLDSLAQAQEVGRALGVFHRLVRDIPPQRLAITLPGFHATPDYLQRFLQVYRRDADSNCPPEIRGAAAFAAARRTAVDVLEEARRSARIPQRVIHGDPKLQNILFDAGGSRVISLIDLDTVQPGLVHYDIGDCLRSCCNRQGERPHGGATPTFELDFCQAILSAYAKQTKNFLAPSEVALLYDAVRLIPFELGLRFLTDHLEGNRYFRSCAPGENLKRAQVQFALLQDIEQKEKDIRSIIADSFSGEKRLQTTVADLQR